MAQINATELRSGVVIYEGGQLLQVLTYEHVKMGRGSGTIKVKVKNLRTGAVMERSYITGARVEEAILEKRKAVYLYRDGEVFYFMDPTDFEQFSLNLGVLGEQAKFLRDNMEVTLIISRDETLGIELPNSLTYVVSETGPGERGNSVSNVYKDAVLENGLVVKVPMFVGVGDLVRIDVRTGLYIERVK